MFLSLTWSNRTPHKFSLISHFKVYHRERAREIVWLLAAPSVLETEKLTHGKDYQWLKYIKVLWRDVNTLIARLLLCSEFQLRQAGLAGSVSAGVRAAFRRSVDTLSVLSPFSRRRKCVDCSSTP